MMKRKELTEKRTANRKFFENRNHTMTAEIYLDAVHYQEEDGSWKDMDDALEETDSESQDTSSASGESMETDGYPAGKEKDYMNRKGSLKIRFANKAKAQGTVTMSKEKASLSWSLDGAEKVKAQKSGKSDVYYPNILPGVDAHCCVSGERVKEDLILTGTEAAPNCFTYLYRMKNLTPVLKGNHVAFVNEQEEEVFFVHAPYMKDEKGEKSEAIRLSLEKEKKGSCRITFTPDAAWLKDGERQYPVVIDPLTTTSKAREDIMDAHVSSLYEEDNFQSSILLKTKGGDEIVRSFLRFDLPEIHTGDMVVGARLVMVSLAEDGKERTVQVHKVLQNWNSATINWYNKPIYEETVQDLCKYKGDKQKYVTLDITRLVKDWYQNGNNFGLMIKDDYELSGYTEFLSSDCDNGYQEMRPRIEIDYRNFSGLEDYWTYHSQNVGRAGTVHVNDYNGNLILKHSTLEMGGNRMPVSLSHVYNTNNRTENLGYGNGFRLSYHQTLKKMTIANEEYYQYVNGDGAVHYFRYDNTKKKWVEENGLDLTLTINTGTSEPLVIKDKEDNQLVFNSSGYLVKVRDKNSNAVDITYTNKQITKISDGADRVTNLTYQTDSSGTAYLSQITAPSGQKKIFAYTSGNLTSITDVDGEKVSYTYDSKNMLTSAANVDGYTVKYSYYGSNPYRVKKITEYSGTAEGNSLTLTYGYNSTKFTDNKKRSEIHRFDDFGNLLHIHDGFGHAASGKYCGEEKNAYRLENETKLQANVVQLLKDPIIQAQTVGWESKVSPAGAGTTAINTNTSYCKVGTRSLRAESTTLTGYAYWAQSVTVKKGETYTVSMYVRASVTEAAEDGGALLRVRYMDKNNDQQLLDSEVINRTTNGFVLLKRTFTVPTDASSDSIKIYMVMWHAIGWMCGDMAQLETGDTVNRCNLVDNGDFHLGSVSGFTKTGRVIDGLTTVGTALPIPVQNALTVTASSAVLYYRPSTTETQVATVTKGQHLASEISVTADSTNWYRVRTADGKQGYIQTSKAIPYLGGAEGQNSAVVGVSGAILRATASDSGTPVEEAIPKGTCLSLVNNKLDANGRRWYYVGMQIDKKRYFGYIREDCIIRLCRNRPYGTLTADDKLYKTMSLSGTVAANLSAGRKVYLRGVAIDSSGKKWYSVVSGKEFVFLQEKNLEIGLEPVLDRIKTSSVKESIGGLEEHIFRFIGDPAMDKKLTKTLDISGKKGDTYMVNAWGRGTAVPATENGKNERHFGTEVVFVAADGTTDAHYAEFSPDILDWQFLSDICVAKKDYTSIKVSYTYCRNANQAFFDGLALYREQFGQSYTYDDENNLISVTDAQKNAAKFEFNSANDMTGVVDARGNKFTYEYDTKHNVTKGTSAEGIVYSLSYDEAGNVKKSGCVDPKNTAAGTWMNRTFTSDKNHVKSVTDAGNNTVQYAWDTTKDLLNSMTDARGNQITYGYDTADRLTFAAQNVTLDGTVSTVRNTYTYSKDRLTAIGHNGFSYGFTYDGFGNTLSASVAGNQVVGYEYAAKNGNLEKITYGNGDYIRYTYDSQDRVQLSYFKGASDSAEQKLNEYVYDKEGNPAQIISHMSGKTYSLFYDFLGRLMRVVDEQGTFYEYTYDAENSMTRICHAANGSNLVNTVYTYDKDGRELTAKASSNYIRTTAYDTFGRVASRSWSTPAEYVSSYTYFDSGNNRYNLPKTVTNGGEKLTYAYDANGNITSITDSNGTSTFRYDELNQLIRENNHVLNKTITYSYDLGGNLKNVKEYAFTTAEGLPASPVKTETGTYDSVWKDKLMNWNGTAMTYDAVGNMLTKGNTAYTWTQGRKLSGVNNGKSIQYYYDHTGARTKKAVDGVTTEYRMAGDLLVSEKTGSQTYWYRYDSSANLISATIKGKIYYYVRNAQNDVIALVDSTGAVVVKYTYDSWGKVISITGSLADSVGVQNPFRYRGYYYDNETGMYYLRNRYYDPVIRRFISADNLISSTNIFTYCENNPVNKVDYDGHTSITITSVASGFLTSTIKGIVGIVVGIVVGVVIDKTKVSMNKTRNYSSRDAKSTSWSSSKTYDDILPGIAGQYGNFKCIEAASAMLSALKAKRQHGNVITLRVEEDKKLIPTYIWSESRGMNISENGIHRGIEYRGIVYCNVHPMGLPERIWIDDFMAPVGEVKVYKTIF